MYGGQGYERKPGGELRGPCPPAHRQTASGALQQIVVPVPVRATQGYLREATWDSPLPRDRVWKREGSPLPSGRPTQTRKTEDWDSWRIPPIHRGHLHDNNQRVNPPTTVRLNDLHALPHPDRLGSRPSSEDTHPNSSRSFYALPKTLYPRFGNAQLGPSTQVREPNIVYPPLPPVLRTGPPPLEEKPKRLPRPSAQPASLIHIDDPPPPHPIQTERPMTFDIHTPASIMSQLSIPTRKKHYVRGPSISPPPPKVPVKVQDEAEALYMRAAFSLTQDSTLTLADLVDPPDGSRPGYPIPVIAALAIRSSPRQRLVLQEIFLAFQNHFKWYADHWDDKSWKNSIRHNLSLSCLFKPVPRPLAEPGKGNYWVVDFSRGVGNKRPRKRRHRAQPNEPNAISTDQPPLEQQAPTPPSPSDVSQVSSGSLDAGQALQAPFDDGYVVVVYHQRTREVIYRSRTSLKPTIHELPTSIMLMNYGKTQTEVDGALEPKMEDLADEDILGYPTDSEYDELEDILE